MTARPCSLDVVAVAEPSDVVAEVVRVERPRPERSVELTVYEDGSATCDRCGRRHPHDQVLARYGVMPRRVPLHWGRTQAERAADEQPRREVPPWARDF